MPLAPGTRVGAYEVVAAVAAGGMGEVYRARDTRLGRDVALKTLPEAFASDPNRVARFEREARLLATLNHSNIAAIHGVEESPDGAVLVLEFVEGPTLAERLQGPDGALPLDEAIAIARQICDALANAHAHGIIHRDLKPANIKVRPDGTVKVLDLGLAKALVDEDAGSNPSTSPTFTAATRLGVILGTAAYMAPEQARGRAADKRADVWAFGCVLYEMLTGRRPFAGDDVSATLAEVIKGEPDWTAVPEDTPVSIRRLLRRCLVKDPAKRLADISDARLELDDTGDEARPADGSKPAYRRERLAWGTVAIVLAGVAGVALLGVRRGTEDVPALRVEIVTPPPLDASIAISPDGRKIAFVAGPGTAGWIWYRSLDPAVDSAIPRRLPGTEGGRLPFWSSDGKAIGFFTDTHLKRIEIAGGAVQVLANTSTPGGGAWSGDTIILASNSLVGPLYRLPASGGKPVPVTQTVESSVGHRFPEFLPDGQHFLFDETAPGGVHRILVGDLSGAAPSHLLDAESHAVYSGAGYLLFVRQGKLLAHAFDAGSRTLRGSTAVVIGDDVAFGLGGRAAISASAHGDIAYRTGAGTERRRLIWFDRSGKELATVADPDAGTVSNPSLSRDGRRLAVQKTVGGNIDVWLLDLARGAFSRLTTAPTLEALPLWSPDGRTIIFNSFRSQVPDLYMMAADGSSQEQLVVASPKPKRGCDWSRDGSTVLYKEFDPRLTSHDLWAMSLADRKPFLVVGGPGDDRDGQFSPDGKWIAYESNESSRSMIYVQRFPGPGGKEPVSPRGGSQARWSGDGTELFYVDPEGVLMAVPIQLPRGDGTPAIGAPVRLFQTHMPYAGLGVSRQQYVVAPDARRFLVNTVAERESAPITLLLNWKAARQ